MDLTTLTDEELKAELERRDTATNQPKGTDYQPRLAHEYTDADKIAKFDHLHFLAYEHWNSTRDAGYADEDFDNAAAEEVLELLAHPGDTVKPEYEHGKPWPIAPFWKAWRDLTE